MPDPIQITEDDVTPEVLDAYRKGRCHGTTYTVDDRDAMDRDLIRDAVNAFHAHAEPEPPTVALTEEEEAAVRRAKDWLTHAVDAYANGEDDQWRRDRDALCALLARAASPDEWCVVRRDMAEIAYAGLGVQAGWTMVISSQWDWAAAAEHFHQAIGDDDEALTDGTPQRGEGAG